MTSTTGARVVGELGGHVRRALPVRRDSLTPATACTSVAPTRPVPAGEHVAAYRTAAVKLLAPNGVLPTELQAGKVLRTDGGERADACADSNRAASFPRLGSARQLAGAARAAGGKAAAGGRGVALVWFRADLRTHDHEALAAAASESTSLVPVFIFDARDFGQTAAGYDKTGPHRAQFLRECVQDLRARLRAAGSELVVRVGKPAEVLARLVRDTGAGAVYTHQEVTAEESALEGAVAAAVREAGDAELKLYWGSTLYHVADLPFQLPSMPTTYGAFRERMHEVKIRPTVSTPKHLKGLPAGCNLDVGTVPTLEELGVTAKGRNGKAAGKGDEAADVVASSVDKLQGGETEALARLRSFVAHTRRQLREVAGPAASAKGRGGAASAHFSTQVSPWLAMGCLSPRRMYEELRAHTRGTVTGGGADAGTNWLVFELLWRDFFRLLTQYLRPEIVARTHVYTYFSAQVWDLSFKGHFLSPKP